jgi:hemerythrin-like domain-containing protein
MHVRFVGVTILEGLVAEHRVFLTVFDHIERALPGIKTTGEMAVLCRVLGGLLHNHGATENDLAYIALDHILHEYREHTRLYHDHQEIDGLLKQVEKTDDVDKARAQLSATLNACRAHFDDEERVVFPLIERALQPETLRVLGRSWNRRSSDATPFESQSTAPQFRS